MSSNASPDEADWFTELMAMQDAIANLKISPSATEYGVDLNIDDEDPSASEDDFDELFDEILGDDDTYSSDDLGNDTFDERWLGKKAYAYSARNPHGLNGDQLADKLMSVLSSRDSDETLQGTLADILGYEDLDLVAELISHRQEIVSAAQSAAPAPGGGEDAIYRLMTREQREEALRQADIEHKSRPLGPSLKDPINNYPHIYRAHDAGNVLSAFGTKYALPLGSTDTDHKFYKEIMIPPPKVGQVKGKERLVPIREMDMLCQNTFKGLTSLNRMQSLLYSVAYKTNENMLVCAPTGAVRFPFPLICAHVYREWELIRYIRVKRMLRCLQSYTVLR